MQTSAPFAMRTVCSYPGCRVLVANGRCAGHAYAPERPKTAARGYDADWRKLRALKLATDPFCQIRTHCQGAPATEVDHIVPIALRPDLRLVWSNLQSACKPCNAAKRDRAA